LTVECMLSAGRAQAHHETCLLLPSDGTIVCLLDECNNNIRLFKIDKPQFKLGNAES